MPLVVVTTAKPDLLKQMLSKALTLRLYANDVIPAISDTAATFMEAAFTGYAPIRLESGLWIIAGSRAEYDPMTGQSFIADDLADETVYGYFVTRGKRLLWAERFAQPYPVQFFGDEIRVKPTFALE